MINLQSTLPTTIEPTVMNPAVQYPTPQQGVVHNVVPGPPLAPAVVQYTTVNVVAEPPKDHIIWSLLCFVYGNPFCLGLAALVYSFKARDRKVAQDLEGARSYGSTARCLNIMSTIVTCFTVVFSVIGIVVFVRSKMGY